MYEELSKDIENRIAEEKKNSSFTPVAFDNAAAVRRDCSRDKATVLRPPFVRDIDKIINCPYYNRYADKTQVFSLHRNDDITRRGLHVQLVSRIARTIGAALNLNLDLIEAIALGHDIGHTPFGHSGERFLDGISYEYTGRRFSHNIHSVRVLDKVFPYNITLQTLCSIAAHDGELELCNYRPSPVKDFEEFDEMIEKCYLDKTAVKRLIPDTLEGCVVRISDIIAYVGKDRQDAARAHLLSESDFNEKGLGEYNAQIMNNLTVNIIENSYGKDYIMLDERHFKELQKVKSDNYNLVYKTDYAKKYQTEAIKPMMEELFKRLLDDLSRGDTSSYIYRHHIGYVDKPYFKRIKPYAEEMPEQIVIDYIASMTDDYFIALHKKLFPDSEYKIEYVDYFDE
ncbi:MAG: deoxyguanosinetriphosphate triphosphohydrolase family protein [Candidatus Coproplasma sp.]